MVDMHRAEEEAGVSKNEHAEDDRDESRLGYARTLQVRSRVSPALVVVSVLLAAASVVHGDSVGHVVVSRVWVPVANTRSHRIIVDTNAVSLGNGAGLPREKGLCKRAAAAGAGGSRPTGLLVACYCADRCRVASRLPMVLTPAV